MSLRIFGLRWQKAALPLVAATMAATIAYAGGFLGGQGAVGGVLIDANGIVSLPAQKDVNLRLAELRKLMQPKLAEDLNAPTGLRRVSLKRLEQTVAEHLENGQALPEEVVFLAGLQRIEYVLVYPEEQDIVLVGPAEGWKLNDQAEVVGVASGRPVMQLDDLVLALRSAEKARTEGIQCSIDPTSEGRQNLQRLLANQTINASTNLKALEQAMKQAFGPQMITVKGVPASSHFARVLVAADYRMKRLAMNLEQSPVPGLPSYIELIRNRGNGEGTTPRWWLACDFQPLTRSEDGLAWKLEGGVKVMTEDELITNDGQVQATGQTSQAAQQWAELMTERYEALSQEIAAFGQLRNLMDLAVVAALVEGHQLRQQAGYEFPLFFQSDSPYSIRAWNAPRALPAVCSMLKANKGWIVTASGGVDLNSWEIASRSNVDQAVADARAPLQPAKQWWWN